MATANPSPFSFNLSEAARTEGTQLARSRGPLKVHARLPSPQPWRLPEHFFFFFLSQSLHPLCKVNMSLSLPFPFPHSGLSLPGLPPTAPPPSFPTALRASPWERTVIFLPLEWGSEVKPNCLQALGSTDGSFQLRLHIKYVGTSVTFTKKSALSRSSLEHVAFSPPSIGTVLTDRDLRR